MIGKVFLLLMLSFLFLSVGILRYDYYKWNGAGVVSGEVEDVRENCFISYGVFSSANEVCKTEEIKVDGIWWENVGNKIFKVGQEVKLRCIRGECK